MVDNDLSVCVDEVTTAQTGGNARAKKTRRGWQVMLTAGGARLEVGDTAEEFPTPPLRLVFQALNRTTGTLRPALPGRH